MSLPIILAIVLVVAILAWVVVYFVVRQRREAAVRKMFQSDPIDAEIGREALRRVFGILADEDPAPPQVSRPPQVSVPQVSMAAMERPPMALGPASSGSAGRSPAVAPATLARPGSIAPGGTPLTMGQPAINTPAQAAVAAVAAVMAAMQKPAAEASSASSTAFPPLAPVQGPPSPGSYQLFAPDQREDGEIAAAAALPLLPIPSATVGMGSLPTSVTEPAAIPVASPATDAQAGRRGRGSGGGRRRRYIRDGASALLVLVGIAVLAVAVFDPHFSILTGAVSPATATAPAIAVVSSTPSLTPSPTATPSPTPTASPSPSFSPSPSPSPTPAPTPPPDPGADPGADARPNARFNAASDAHAASDPDPDAHATPAGRHELYRDANFRLHVFVLGDLRPRLNLDDPFR